MSDIGYDIWEGARVKSASQAFADIEVKARAFHKKHPSVTEDEAFNWLYSAYSAGSEDTVGVYDACRNSKPPPSAPVQRGWLERFGNWLVRP